MSAKAERPKNRKIKLVGGGYRWSRGSEGKTSGGLKARRRALRNQIKSREITPTQRRELKVQLAELLARKDGR